MAIKATNEQKQNDFIPVPTGNHVMRCFKMIEVGTIKGEYMGQPTHRKKVYIEWELPNEQVEFKPGEGRRPFAIGREFTLSLFKGAALREILESWRGKKYTEEETKEVDILKLVGQPCMGNVVEGEMKDDKPRSTLSGVSILPKGLMCPAQINPSVILQYDNFDFTVYKNLPKWLRDKIATTPEYQGLINNLENHATQVLPPDQDQPAF